jgi:hypothetical protein
MNSTAGLSMWGRQILFICDTCRQQSQAESLRDAILEAAQGEEIVPKDVHDVLTAQEAFYLVAQRVGVSILTKPTMLCFDVWAIPAIPKEGIARTLRRLRRV